MKASDIVALPLQWGSAIRRRRVFHPVGVIANGSLERLASPGEGLPIESSDVVARVSKGIGLPGGLPDIIGLAIKIPPQPFAATPWDILMASAGSGSGVLSRFALRPVTSWRAPMSSLMPLRYDDRYWWVRAQMTAGPDAPGLSLDDISEQIGDGGIEFVLDQAAGTGDFQPLARVRFDEVIAAGPSNGVAFDPTINTAAGVKLAPEWLTEIRRRAYGRSRKGRPDSV